MNKKVIIGVVAVVLVLAGFLGGAAIGPRVSFLRSLGGTAAAGGRGAGGPGGNLTAAEQAQLQNMTAAERQAFMQKKMGSAAPSGATAGSTSGGATNIEGEILEATSETLNIKTTAGGTETVYIDKTTTLAYAKGATADGLDVGDSVIALAAPEGDVLAASAVIIK